MKHAFVGPWQGSTYPHEDVRLLSHGLLEVREWEYDEFGRACVSLNTHVASRDKTRTTLLPGGLLRRRGRPRYTFSAAGMRVTRWFGGVRCPDIHERLRAYAMARP